MTSPSLPPARSSMLKPLPRNLGAQSPVADSSFRKLQVAELAHAARDGGLDRQSLHAACAIEPDDALGVVEDILCVRWFGNRSTMAEDENVFVHALGCVMHRLDAAGRFFECAGR